MKSIMCPNCAAPLELEDTQTHVTCPFCSVTSELKKAGQLIEHYMLPVIYDVEQIRTELVGDILKSPGTPDDLHKSLNLKKVDLKFYPYYIVTVHLRTEYKGNGEYATFSRRYKSGYRNIDIHLKPEQGVFDDEREFIIWGPKEIINDLIDFEISTRGKRYFQALEADKVKAKVVKTVLDVEQAKVQGVATMRDIHKGLMYKELAQIHEVKDKPEVKGIYLLHIPFYFLDFEVKGKRYKATMDAATGRTVITQIPREGSYWFFIGLLSTFFGVIGIAGIYFAVTAYQGVSFFGLGINWVGIFAAITGVVLTIRTLLLGIRTKYRETRRKKR